MIKKIILILFYLWAQIGFSQPKNYKNTEKATLKDAFPNDHEKRTPGRLTKDELKDFKLFLNDKWNVNLDSIKTLHFYYSTNENVCKYVKKITSEKTSFSDINIVILLQKFTNQFYMSNQNQ